MTGSLYDWILICFFVVILLYLIKTFNKRGRRMSNIQQPIQKRPATSGIPPLPPLADSIKKINMNKQQVPVQPVQPVQVAQVAQPVQPVDNNVVEQESEATEEIREIEQVTTETYMSIGSKHGNVEFDLMSHREKGQEVRYLNIQIQGFSLEDRGKVSTTSMAITNQEDFERVKKFFSTLKWED